MATNNGLGWEGLAGFEVTTDEDDSRSSFPFVVRKSPTRTVCEPSASIGAAGGGNHEVPAKKKASDPDCSTPRNKSAGIFGGNVRRRLQFSPKATDSELDLWDLENWLKDSANLVNVGEEQPAGTYQLPTASFQVPPEHCQVPAAEGCNGSSEWTLLGNREGENVLCNFILNEEGLPGNNPVPSASVIGPTFKELPSASVQSSEPPTAAAETTTTTAASETVQEGGSGKTGKRRIAQLVVWTKNGSKQQLQKKETVRVEKELPPAPVPIPSSSSSNTENQPVASTSSADTTEDDSLQKKDPLGDLFYVQYPVRPLTETSKNKGKGKAQKRSRKPSPGSPPKKEGRRKSRKQKRSSSLLVQGSSSGRAYRTYLHSCLEKQRQQLRSGADFKVEKLFQPDQGVALPGEILPSLTEELAACPSTEQSTIDIPVHPPPPQSVIPCDNNPAPSLTNQSILPLPPLELPPVAVPTTTFEPTTFPPQIVDPTPIIETPTNNICDNICDVPSYSNDAISVEESGEYIPLFELPDSFTVTTEPVNEFDLLIQNVIREEMVGNMDEEEELAKSERSRKRMKISNTSSRASSEDRMIIDEPGKPRCTYTELIERALTEAGGLTVSEIYNWISERYPFYKPDDDRWKNSVRHNLSINPYFKKGEKARNGAGHLWTISEESKGLRPPMGSWDERHKSPSSDPFADFMMPIESETDRAVANILGKYISECRANREASEKEDREEKDSTNVQGEEVNPEMNESAQAPVTSEEERSTLPLEKQDTQKVNEVGATCDNAATELTTFNLSELNSGQFTVDLSGITIPEGGSINFEELINNGRLIYIQTDSEANKENESTQAVVLNECMLSELTALTNNTTQDDNRYHSFYSDPLSLELGFGKVSDAISTASYDASSMNLNACATSTAPSGYNTGSIGSSSSFQQELGGACAQLVHSTETESHNQADLTVMDQVITMSSCDGSGMSGNLADPPISSAALYESKELGISYTYQTESCAHDILQ